MVKTTTTKNNQFSDLNANLVTEEGLQKMIDELDDLKNRQLIEIAGKLKEAVAQGDLSENAEYADAKDQQQMVIMRMSELEENIKKAEIIKKTASTEGKLVVRVGCSVTVSNLSRNKADETYIIVGSLESNPFEGKISNTSPLGRALLGNKEGDKVKIDAPAGEMTYKIIKIV